MRITEEELLNLQNRRRKQSFVRDPKTPSDAINGVKEMRLILPFPPSLNMMYPTNSQGRRFLSKRGEQFKAEAQIRLGQQKARKFTGALSVTLKLFRPKKIGDIDNYSKGVFDSMKGICFDDDKQITELHIFRYDDKDCPRVEVLIKEF